MLPLLMGGLAGLNSLSQLYTSHRQRRAADRLNPIRPTYTVAPALNESVEMARQGAGANMPGMGNALNNLHASTANGVRAATLAGSGNNALAAIAALQGNEATGLNQLQAQQAQYANGQRMTLQNNLSALAQEQRNAFQYNEADKFREESQAKSGLTGASIQNLHSGLSGLGNLSMAYLGGRQNQRQEQQANQQHVNNFAGQHTANLNQMRNTPLFGGVKLPSGLNGL